MLCVTDLSVPLIPTPNQSPGPASVLTDTTVCRLEDKEQCNPGREGYEAEELCTGAVYEWGEWSGRNCPASCSIPTSTKRYVLTTPPYSNAIFSLFPFLVPSLSNISIFSPDSPLTLSHLPDTECASVTTGSTSTDVMDLPLISISVTVKPKNTTELANERNYLR
eukprot:sb/3472564/